MALYDLRGISAGIVPHDTRTTYSEFSLWKDGSYRNAVFWLRFSLRQKTYLYPVIQVIIQETDSWIIVQVCIKESVLDSHDS